MCDDKTQQIGSALNLVNVLGEGKRLDENKCDYLQGYMIVMARTKFIYQFHLLLQSNSQFKSLGIVYLQDENDLPLLVNL